MKGLKLAAPITALLLLAAINFLLLLRHKSVYLSDSYFYKHVFYEMLGDDFSEARYKTLSGLETQIYDEISKNFFFNENAYRNSLAFFTKRPMYPFIATLFFRFGKNIDFAFIFPQFVAYLGCIYLFYIFLKQSMAHMWGVLGAALLVGFYPLLDWSSYILTDTLSTFFWLLEMLFVWYYLKSSKRKWLVFYALFLVISLLNREQTVLFLPYSFLLLISSKIIRIFKRNFTLTKNVFLVTLLIVSSYLIASILTKQKSLYDTIIYTQNNYGLTQKSYTIIETAIYFKNEIIKTQVGLVEELLRYRWWLVVTVIGVIGILRDLVKQKLMEMDILMLVSGVSAYLSLFFYPVLSYRYIYPTIIMLIYFALKHISLYFENLETNKEHA